MIEKGGTDGAECETCGMTFKYFVQLWDEPPDECTCCFLGVDPEAPRHRCNDKERDITVEQPDFDKEGFGV